MKKILYSIFIISFSLFLLGCGKEMTAREAVSNYLENYITLDSSVTEELDNFVKEAPQFDNMTMLCFEVKKLTEKD